MTTIWKNASSPNKNNNNSALHFERINTCTHQSVAPTVTAFLRITESPPPQKKKNNKNCETYPDPSLIKTLSKRRVSPSFMSYSYCIRTAWKATTPARTKRSQKYGLGQHNNNTTKYSPMHEQQFAPHTASFSNNNSEFKHGIWN